MLLDAFALGVLPDVTEVAESLAGRLVLTPNPTEAALLLGVDEVDDDARARIATKYGAVVTCRGTVAAPDGRTVAGRRPGCPGWPPRAAVTSWPARSSGLLARGADADQAACWATHLHAAAGDRLAARVGRVGYLARELVDELPALLTELAP